MVKKHKVPKLMGVHEVFDYLGYWKNKGAIYTLIARGSFPKPVQYLKSGPIWIEQQIKEYKKQHESRENPYSSMRRNGKTEELKNTFKDSIDACIKSVGHLPSTYEYRLWAKEVKAVTYNTIIRHLVKGGFINDTKWESALNFLGYSIDGKPDSPVVPEFTHEECINALKQCYESLRIAFSMRQYDSWARKRPRQPTARQIIRTVGNFNEAKELAGVPKLQSIKDIY